VPTKSSRKVPTETQDKYTGYEIPATTIKRFLLATAAIVVLATSIEVLDENAGRKAGWTLTILLLLGILLFRRNEVNLGANQLMKILNV
jgi:hypothetical protein